MFRPSVTNGNSLQGALRDFGGFPLNEPFFFSFWRLGGLRAVLREGDDSAQLGLRGAAEAGRWVSQFEGSRTSMNIRVSVSESPWIFFLLVFMLSVPFWLIGAITGQFLPKEIPIKLPISSLMAFNPLIAAVILAYREDGSDGVKELLKRSVDYRRIKRKSWYVPIVCFMPITMVVEFGLMDLMGASLPDPQVPILMVPVLFVVFFVAAVGEEVGWQGYAIDRLQDRWNALEASLILGIVWAIWHIVPFMQSHRTLPWIAWQCLGTIVARILIVWLYNCTGKSVFATVLYHAMSNVSVFLFPNYGSHYDPFITWLITAFTAAIVIFVWGPETLARYRYARLSGSDAKR